MDTRPHTPPASQPIRRSLDVPEGLDGLRLDQAAAELWPDFSRSRLKAWILDGCLTLDGHGARPRDRVLAGQHLSLDALPDSDIALDPQAVDFAVVHRDEHLLVIDKPAGLVVHPGAGNADGTLQNGLLHLDPALAAVPRCGIVHRLDKDTSGLMVVARTLAAHTALVAALARRDVRREYLALCWGEFSGGGSVDAPIGRHPRDRTRMAVTGGGRTAVTHYRVARRYAGLTLLDVTLETGRTHQIRVHLAHLRHPIVGDPVYGGRPRLPPGATPPLQAALRAFPRQALHARRLALAHPVSGEAMEWTAPLPADLAGLLALLDESAAAARADTLR